MTRRCVTPRTNCLQEERSDAEPRRVQRARLMRFFVVLLFFLLLWTCTAPLGLCKGHLTRSYGDDELMIMMMMMMVMMMTCSDTVGWVVSFDP